MKCKKTASTRPFQLACLLTLSLALGAAACTDSSPDGPEPTALDCGQGQAFELEAGVATCVYSGDLLVETGFQCPPEAPFMNEVEGWAVCHGDADLPGDAPDLLGGEFGPYCPLDEGCNDEPVEGPLRVLLMVDQSLSIAVTDPASRRVDAAWELSQAVVELEADSAMAIVGFSASATIYTNSDTETAFTRNPGELANAGNQLALVDRTTNWLAALDAVDSIVDNEILLVDPGPRFVVIWVTDGLPDVAEEPGPDWTGEVTALRANAETAGASLSFNAVYLDGGGPVSAEELLTDMVEAGGGRLSTVGIDDPMSFLFAVDELP